MTADQLLIHLQLTAHPLEGGFFKRIYESDRFCNTPTGRRKICTSIHYMLTRESPIGYLHRNESDILHFFQLGSALRYHMVSPLGEYRCAIVGSNIAAGETLQLMVPGGYWKASELLGDSGYGLISEVVTPGFEYSDNQLADLHTLDSFPEALRPSKRLQLTRFIKTGDYE